MTWVRSDPFTVGHAERGREPRSAPSIDCARLGQMQTLLVFFAKIFQFCSGARLEVINVAARRRRLSCEHARQIRLSNRDKQSLRNAG